MCESSCILAVRSFADADTSLAEMTEPFDIIFVDLEFSAYVTIVKQILDRRLLAEHGIILVDNGASGSQSAGNVICICLITLTARSAVFARGFAVDNDNTANIDPAKIDHWIEAGKLVTEFNSFVAGDKRISVIMLPFFDGISEIRWKV